MLPGEYSTEGEEIPAWKGRRPFTPAGGAPPHTPHPTGNTRRAPGMMGGVIYDSCTSRFALRAAGV